MMLMVSFGVVSCRMDSQLLKHETKERFRICRYDRLVADYVATKNFAGWLRLNTEYSRETKALIENVLQIGRADSEGIDDSLRSYYKQPLEQRLEFDVARTFADLSEEEEQLGHVLQQLSNEVSDFVCPKVYTQVSGLNQSIVVGDSLLGISLDKYLGADYSLYSSRYNANQRVTMCRGRMVHDCLVFYLNGSYPPPSKDPSNMNLLQSMLRQGKFCWVIAKYSAHELIDVAGYVPSTKQWYLTHEKEVWQRLNNPQVLHNAEPDFIYSILASSHANPYFQDPHSRGVGLWIGMRIVDSYMRTHPQVSVEQLLHSTDYERLLQESHYNPA